MTRNGAGVSSIVFIHGSGCNGALWAYQRRFFSRDFRVVALDLPGHGRNQSAPRQRVEEMAEFVLAEIERLGLEAPALVGHSLGGAIALQVALDRPAALGALVPVGTGARLKVQPSFLEAILTDYHGALATMAGNVFSPSSPRATVDQAMAEIRKVPAAILHGDLSACSGFDVMTRLGEIHLPTLAIVGQDDFMTPIKYSDYLRANIPNARMEVIGGAGHMVMLEQPDRFNAALDSFLRSLWQ